MAFQSTPSAWRETMCNGYDIPMSYHFNPLPPHGGRPYLRYTSAGTPRFQSTPSAWRETDKKGGIRHNGDYFNPLPPHGGRLFIFVRSDVESVISIHSLRMEGDLLTALWRRAYFHFNPLPPHGGRQIALSHPELQQYFNPLPPHGGRHTPCQMFCDPCFISIHSLRMEGDCPSKCAGINFFHFNPLPPHGGRRARISQDTVIIRISIHSLRMEGDLANDVSNLLLRSFQSTPSAWRETERKRLSYNIDMHFNPLPPHGGRLLCFSTFFAGFYISIHSLRMEGDNLTRRFRQAVYHFNPLPPHGGRRIYISKRIHFIHFNPLPPHGGRLWTTRYYGYGDFISIHSLRMEGDSPYFAQIPAEEFISIHSLRMEGDVSIFNFNNSGRHFNPLPPHGGRPFPGRRKKFHHAFQSTPSAWRETISVQKL